MRPLLLTGYDDAMACIGDLTAPLMERYAYRHDLDFHCVREYESYTHPAWQKLELVAAALKWGSPYVIWLDADMVITNPASVPPPQPTPKALGLSRDWGEDATGSGDFSTGAFVAGEGALPILEEAMTRTRWQNAPLWDQSALREVWADCPWARERVQVLPRCIMNPVPDSVCPGKVVTPWRPGDWLCHLTMVPFPRRVELFYEIARQIAVPVHG